MTEKRRRLEKKLLVCKIIWYVCGTIAALGFFFFVVCPEVQMLCQLMGLYTLAAFKGMLLIWWIYLVVLVLVTALGILFEGAIAVIFFSRLREAAFESIENLLRGKSVALSR